MQIEAYDSSHVDAVVHLSLRAWSPVSVDPDYQRRGIAMALTDFAVDRMKEAGMEIAMVETGGDPGHAPARAAYEKAGFRVLPLARYFRKL